MKNISFYINIEEMSFLIELMNLKMDYAKEECRLRSDTDEEYNQNLKYYTNEIDDDRTIYEFKVSIGYINPIYMWYNNNAYNNEPYHKRRSVFYDTIRQKTIKRNKKLLYPNLIKYFPSWKQKARFHQWYW